jgi:hypothetical protein
VLRGEPVVDDAVPEAGFGRAGPIAGRDGELAALVRSWDEASRGVPSCVLVVGDAGIGKTGLIDALANEVRATGALAVAARCYESEQSLFLQPVVEALREIVGTLPHDLVVEAAGPSAGALAGLVPELARVVGSVGYERSTPEMERRRTFEAVATFLTAISKRRPLLVILDDLHNAGASTLELVHFVLRWDRSARLLIAATVQSDHRATVEAQLGARAITVQLGPLSGDTIALLAGEAGHPEIASELMRLTKGHTLFVLEALKAVARSEGGVTIPDSLRSAVSARVAHCGPDVEEFLRGAVVAGSALRRRAHRESGEPHQRIRERLSSAASMRVMGGLEARPDLLAVDEVDECASPRHSVLRPLESSVARPPPDEVACFT